jgi:hypothetical protein
VLSSLNIFSRFAICNSKSFIIFPIKSITLESLESNCSSYSILKINKTIIKLTTLLSLFFYQPSLNESRKRSKDMSHLSFMTIIRDTIDIKTTSSIRRNVKKFVDLLLTLVGHFLRILSLGLRRSWILHLWITRRILRSIG